MVTGKLRRSGNSFIVTVPREEVERLGLAEGDLISLEVRRAEVRPVLAADLRNVFEEEFRRGRAGLQYLAEH